jgi:hypothetical protein
MSVTVQSGWGLQTDFILAMNHIDKYEVAKVRRGETTPNFVVLSVA